MTASSMTVSADCATVLHIQLAQTRSIGLRAFPHHMASFTAGPFGFPCVLYTWKEASDAADLVYTHPNISFVGLLVFTLVQRPKVSFRCLTF